MLFLSMYLALASATKINFGPSNCVSLSYSPKKTCILETNCIGKEMDLEKFEFAFTCTKTNKEIQKHSFGVGGFDPIEKFDTDVQCEICGPPPEDAFHHTGEHKKEIPVPTTNLNHATSKENNDEETKKEEEKKEVKEEEKTEEILPTTGVDGELAQLVDQESKVATGPGNCVSIYRKKESKTCVIHTECENESMDNYKFGLDCIDMDGNLQVRHLFGQNSFLAKEWFDTLITCGKCIAMVDVEDDSKTTDKRINNLEKQMLNVKGDIEKLSKNIAEKEAQANPEFLLKNQKNEGKKKLVKKKLAHIQHKDTIPRSHSHLRQKEEEKVIDEQSDDASDDDDQ